jgi:phosphate transport system substrate-binding protein
VIAEIYQGKITTWNNAAIQGLNKGVKLPSRKIVVVARGDSSGTTYIFTNWLNAAAPSVWTTAPSKAALVLPSGGLNPQGNGGVANSIAGTAGAIGYVEYSYILLNGKLASGTANILNKSGKFVAPSTKSIAVAAAVNPNVSATSFSIVNEPGAGSYPIVGYTWAIVWKVSQINDNQGTLLVKYLDWLSHSGTGASIGGQNIAAEQGYVPLPANIQALATKSLLQVTGGANHAVLLQKSAS